MADAPSTLSPVFRLAHDYVDRVAELNPIAATSMGVPGHEEELPDLSPAGAQARIVHARETLAALRALTVAGERDRVAAEVMRERLELALELHETRDYLREVRVLGSPISAVRSVFDQMPRDSEEAWERIARRMQRIPEALAGARASLQTGLAEGVRAAQRQAREVARQARVWSGVAEGSRAFFDGLVEQYGARADASAALRAELERAARAASDAYAEMATYLDEGYAPRAEPRDAVGAERYALQARAYTGATLDLLETYAWGWEELTRIETEMEATAAQVVPSGGVDAARELLESDPERAIEGVEAFRRWMQELQDATIAELDGTHFDIPEPVRRIEAMIAPPGGALAMYYTGPSEDFSRPGRTWYPTGGRTRFPLWSEVSVAYHEGVPGHHLQIALLCYLAEELSRYQRLLALTSGYAEGWALYAERLMEELDYLEHPDYRLGMLVSQAFRAARVVVDIGMHLELEIPAGQSFHPGARWTPELGLEFMTPRNPFDEAFARSEIDRYLGVPGQAISYKVGERYWLAAREAANRAEGARFELKAWHAKALRVGPMGLDQLRRELGG